MNLLDSLHSQMFHVYLLRSKKDKLFYVGHTNDLDKRLKEHNEGKVGHTSKHKPWDLVYYEGYVSLLDAQEREKALKRYGKAFKILKLRIKDSLKEKEGVVSEE